MTTPQQPSGPQARAPRSADEALRRIDDDIAAAQARARQATYFRQTLDDLRGAATVHGVTVTLDSAGGLRDVAFPQRVDRTGEELRADVLAALQEARRQVADAVRREAAVAFGDSSDVTRRMDQELRQRFGDV